MGHAANKRERIENLERLLLSGWFTPTELAKRLGCDRTTIHHDLTEIELTHPLINENGHYRLDPAGYVSNIRLTPAEALTIYLALRRFIRQTSKAPTFFVSAIQKISATLRHPNLTTQLVQSSLMLEDERSAADKHAEIWQILLQGWLNKTVVRLEYQKGRGTEIGEHDYEPYLFEPAVLSHGVYVIGWSRTRDQIRTFKIDRITGAYLTGETFTPKNIQVDDLLKNAWGVWYGQELITVELRFAPGVVKRVLETIWHPSQRTQLLEDGNLLWTIEIAATLELISWIRGWGHEVEVLKPEKLRQEIADSLRAAAALYD
ncbi:MAG: helix-turn-helix transcriptional regulator [Aggregatilineales bacterium]